MPSRKVLLSLVSGVVASFALPPFAIFPAIWCLAYPAIQFAREEKRSQALWIIAAMGMGWFTASTHWVAHSLLVGEAEFWYLLPATAIGLPALLALFWVGAGAVAWRRWRCAASSIGSGLRPRQSPRLPPGRARRHRHSVRTRPDSLCNADSVCGEKGNLRFQS